MHYITQPTSSPGLINTFICHCADCHKFTSSMFSSNFTIADSHLTHLRGRANLSAYTQARSVASGNTVTNHFCKTCGSLLYRTSSGYPGFSVLRVGTVDDFHLHEGKLRPGAEEFVVGRVGWLNEVEGAEQSEGSSL